jgi:hypothetical protein
MGIKGGGYRTNAIFEGVGGVSKYQMCRTNANLEGGGKLSNV